MYQSDAIAAMAFEHRRDLLRDGDRWRFGKAARTHDRRPRSNRAHRSIGLQAWFAALRISVFGRVSAAGRHAE
ncbi:hypothetical protein [Pseudonocardia sp. GCM10023141]|uniref:hypothetical protein n=1 Tax=Pseudonocardia sp. GCM10023141 TaxID=3252653 RepID=UPI00361CAA7F